MSKHTLFFIRNQLTHAIKDLLYKGIDPSRKSYTLMKYHGYLTRLGLPICKVFVWFKENLTFTSISKNGDNQEPNWWPVDALKANDLIEMFCKCFFVRSRISKYVLLSPPSSFFVQQFIEMTGIGTNLTGVYIMRGGLRDNGTTTMKKKWYFEGKWKSNSYLHIENIW